MDLARSHPCTLRVALTVTLLALGACRGDGGAPEPAAEQAAPQQAAGAAPSATSALEALAFGLSGPSCQPPPALVPEDRPPRTDLAEQMGLIESLERQIATASEADLPRLMLEAGRAKDRLFGGDSLLEFVRARPESFGRDEIQGAYLYTGNDFRDVLERFPSSDVADDAAYALTLLQPGGECEGWIDCYAGREWYPLADFLRAFPDSPLTAQAVARAVAAVSGIDANRDLRDYEESYNPPGFRALAASFDSVGGGLPSPHGAVLLERAAILWWQLAELGMARDALEAAASRAAAEHRECLESRAAAFPSRWLTLDTTRVIHPGRVMLTWQNPAAAVDAFVVHRSDIPGDLGPAIATLPADARGWSDTTTEPGRSYWYRLLGTGSSGALGSNLAAASTPGWEFTVLEVSVSLRDAHLLVFGILANGFPQVMRISPEGAVERRDAAFFSINDRRSRSWDYVDEIWAANNGRPGALRYSVSSTSPATAPPELIGAIRVGADLMAGYFELPNANRVALSVGEETGQIRVFTRRESFGREAWVLADCAESIGACWLSRRDSLFLRSDDGASLARLQMPASQPEYPIPPFPRWLLADPRDGGVWVVVPDGHLFHFDRAGTPLADLALTAPDRTYSLVVTGDLSRDRVLWLVRADEEGNHLARIAVDAANPVPQLVMRDVPSLPKLVPDLSGGVWLVTRERAMRVGPDGEALIDVPLAVTTP